MLLFIQFAAITGVILLTGGNLSRYGDVIAEKTNLGRAWVGVILLASVTSLPELFTGISSIVIIDVPNIAAGDVLGSCMFNILILAFIDLLDRTSPVSARAQQGHVLTGAFGILILGLVVLGLATSQMMPIIGWVSASSLALILLYLVAIRMVFLYERRRNAESAHDLAEARYQGISTRKAVTMYGINALIIVAAASYLPFLGEQIAEITGLGQTFVGTIFIAFSTSLPELVVSVTAFKIGAVDLVYGNILGSNLFNLVILAIDDILYTKGALLAAVSGSHIVAASAAMAMTAVAIIGLTYRAERKGLPLAWDALGILVLYVGSMAFLYTLRPPS